MISDILQTTLRFDLWLPVLVLVAILVLHLASYFIDSHYIRRNGVTGPILARFSDIWLSWAVVHGQESEVVYGMHKKYGTFVRVAPNHVSISDPEALHVVYGHGSRTLKSDYYDVFNSVRPSIFSTRSRAEHARKRKAISHVFSLKSILEFEQYIHLHITEFLEQLDKACDGDLKTPLDTEFEMCWEGQGGRVWFDIMPWLNYLAFDIIGDLAFGSPFGMIRNAKDTAPVAVDQKAYLAQRNEIGADTDSFEGEHIEVKEVPTIEVLNSRNRLNAFLGTIPPSFRPIVTRLPQSTKGVQHTRNFVGLAVAAVAKRLASPTDRADILSKLLLAKDEHGMPPSREDLTTDAITQLVAGSDTVSSTLCAIIYYIAANPRVQAKLQMELNDVMGDSGDPVAHHDQVKHLPYFNAVINESLRLQSTSGKGLPRVIGEGGLTVCGKWFPEGTCISVPSYTIHRDPAVWGIDVDVFRPERWLECDPSIMQKAFNAFSFGPRACIGRNLAMMELYTTISSIIHRYDIVLEEPDKPLEIHETFIRRPIACHVGLKRRHI